jgi:hypothetical protein
MLACHAEALAKAGDQLRTEEVALARTSQFLLASLPAVGRCRFADVPVSVNPAAARANPRQDERLYELLEIDRY